MCTEIYKAAIRGFLAKHVRVDKLTDDDHLFEKGYVNSLMAIELVLFAESEYSLKVENEDLNLDNFGSVNAIADFIDRKVNHRESQ
jgi:acyl carrier protein